jgi:hypothetical protein
MLRMKTAEVLRSSNLSIVVVIIGILAAIAIPMAAEAQGCGAFCIRDARSNPVRVNSL